MPSPYLPAKNNQYNKPQLTLQLTGAPLLVFHLSIYPSPREQGSPGGTAHGLAVVLLQGDARAGQLVKVGRDDLLQVQVQRHQQGVSSTWLCFTLFSVLFIDYIYSVLAKYAFSIMSCHFSGGYFRYIELLIFKIP